MDPVLNISRIEAIGQAAGAGVAIVVIGAAKRVVETFNDNSICSSLNPKGSLCGDCDRYCGEIPKRVAVSRNAESYECHAGLSCRAVPIECDHLMVAIVGRTFVKAENYRSATERSITGDWQHHSAQELFDNVLFTSSEAIDAAARKVEGIGLTVLKESLLGTATQNIEPPERPRGNEPDMPRERHIPEIVERFNREVGLDPKFAGQKRKPEAVLAGAENEPLTTLPKGNVVQQLEPSRAPELSDEQRDSTILRSREWRSFIGSLSRTNYPKAVAMLLDRLCENYGISGAIWLEESGGAFENFASTGDLRNRRVNLDLKIDDERLIYCMSNERSLVLSEDVQNDPGENVRRLHLFPIGAGSEISSAIAIFEYGISDQKQRQIANLCRAIASPIEILRLRNRVAANETMAYAVKKFSGSLRQIDSDDFWFEITQCAAEILRAERVSLMTFDEVSNSLTIRAMIGSGIGEFGDNSIGQRASMAVFNKGAPVLISNIAKTGLPPAPADRGYRTASCMICPIVLGDKKLGVINFADRASGLAFDKGSLSLFHAIAPQLAVAVDRAILKSKAGEFEQLSVTDPLTGLLNRRYIEARLAEEIKRSNRHGFPMSFMMLDVDEFKSYNDHFGHPAGDDALRLVGKVIRDTLRSADVAARFGGEEFSILLPQTTSEEAMIIAERIRQNIEQERFQHRSVTASIGVASCSAELCVSADLVSAADKALYQAKAEGRNRVLAFESIK